MECPVLVVAVQLAGLRREFAGEALIDGAFAGREGRPNPEDFRVTSAAVPGSESHVWHGKAISRAGAA